MKMPAPSRAIAALACALLCVGAQARSAFEEQLLERTYGDEAFISIATGSRQLISQAPAVATVITADDIQAMGAVDLDEVLAAVPGMHVSRSPRGYSPLYTIRGIYAENNPQVLVLINDIPITNVYVGDRSQVWGGMPVNNIARIEVIRGPGSAVHGADAFAGTINIITRSAADIDGIEAGTRLGSHRTREGWLLSGTQWRGLDIALAIEARTTRGPAPTIGADAQTGFDQLSGTRASLAPGSVHLGRDWIEGRLDVSSGPWRLRIGHQGRRIETGAGAGLALDPQGRGTGRRTSADLSWNRAIARDWDVTALLSHLHSSARTDLVLYPPGAFGFGDGVIGNPHVYERHTRASLSAFYHGFDRHRIRLGFGAVHNDMYRVRESKNYVSDPDLLFVPLAPGGRVVDVSHDPAQVFIRPNDRRVFYVFAQDEWRISPAWSLTGGLRHDHYSDFGDTTNPRAALVWQTTYALTSKLLYGRAFRAPSFSELYNINNPLALGNRYLRPEVIDTWEVAFRYEPASFLDLGLNLFHYRMADVIRFSPLTGTAENSGRIRGRGYELEARITPTEHLSVAASYAYQHAEDQDGGGPWSKVANAPKNLFHLLGSWEATGKLSLHGRLSWVANRPRAAGDTRPEPQDYLTTDVSLRYRSTPALTLALIAHNLFDTSGAEPSPRMLAPGTPMIPDDLPIADRQVLVEAAYRFR